MGVGAEGAVGQVAAATDAATVLQAGRDAVYVRVDVPAVRPDPDDAALDLSADRLAAAMDRQWRAAARGRRLVEPAPLPIRWRRVGDRLAGPPDEATRYRGGGASFDPLPGLEPVRPERFHEGDRAALFAVYGGLPSGRLVVAGGPGTGKSSAAVLLLLDALHHRARASAGQRSRIPVPVLFTLRDWTPITTPVDDWLVLKLSEIPLLRGRSGRESARRLLDRGRIAVFLDGLDELPEPSRSQALRALGEQAAFRLVLLSRTTDLAAAARRHVLTSAAVVELRPLRAADAAGYLLRPVAHPAPRPWRALTEALVGTDGPVPRALTTPLAVTLLRDVYAPGSTVRGIGPVDELLDTARFPDADAITRHLLAHAVTAAYSPSPGRPAPRYREQTALRALTLIARHLGDRHSRDLTWWTIAAWLPTPLRVLLGCAAAMLLTGSAYGAASLLAGGLGTWPRVWREIAPWYALVDGFPTGLAAVLAFTLTTSPRRAARVCATAAGGLAAALVPGLLLGGWGLSASAFGTTFAITYGVTSRLRGTAVLKSLAVTRGFRSTRRIGVALLIGLAFGVAIGVFGGCYFLLQGGDLSGATGFGLSGLLWSLAIITPLTWLTGAFTCDPTAHDGTGPAGPVDAWRGDFLLWMLVGTAYGLGTGLSNWLAYDGSVYAIADGRLTLLAEALLSGLATGTATGVVLARSWPTTVTQLWFTLRHRTPLRLGRFLADCESRHLLRTVGPIYQFRHATLQDHLGGR
ncbi:hypothetical protein [Actinosynnema sp. NPDC020468]|uniref:hypothetical protein n=1 Tax=Actinosynnema sp. NPDC020468 TaxID=3154488 RepID=UPI0033D3A575